MKIENTNSQKIVKGGDFKTAKVEVNTQNSHLLSHFLRDKIYSEKEWAVLREYAANGVDEHRTHNISRKVLIQLKKTGTEWSLIVRDYANGLDYDGITKIFGCYLSSTKSGNNKAIGGFGVGSKAGHAYAHSFFVTSWHKGERAEYMFSKASSSEDSEAEIITLSEGQKDLDPSGISVRVPIQHQHVTKFKSLMRTLSSFSDKLIDFQVEDNYGKLSKLSGAPEVKRKGVKYLELSNSQFQYILCGIVPYKMDRPFIKECMDVAALNVGIKNSRGLQRAIGEQKFVPVVPIGSISVALSRETVDKTAKTKAVIVKCCEERLLEVKESIKAEVKKIKTIKDLWAFERNEGGATTLPYVIENVVAEILSSNSKLKGQYDALKSPTKYINNPLSLIELSSDQNGTMKFLGMNSSYGTNYLSQSVISAVSSLSPLKKVIIRVVHQDCTDVNGDVAKKIHQVSKQGYIRAKVSEDLTKSDFFGKDNEEMFCLIWKGKSSDFADKSRTIKELKETFAGESWIDIEIINNPSTKNRVTFNKFNKDFLGYDFEQVKRRSMMEMTFDEYGRVVCSVIKDEDIDTKNGIHAYCSGVTEGEDFSFNPKKLDINSSVDKDGEDKVDSSIVIQALSYYEEAGVKMDKKFYFSFKAKKAFAVKMKSMGDYLEELGKANAKKIGEDYAASEHSSVRSLDSYAKIEAIENLMKDALGENTGKFHSGYNRLDLAPVRKPNFEKVFTKFGALKREKNALADDCKTVKVKSCMPTIVTKHKVDKDVEKMVKNNLEKVNKSLDKLHEKYIILSRSNEGLRKLIMFVIAESYNFSSYSFWHYNSDKFGWLPIPSEASGGTVFAAAFHSLNN